MGLDSTGTQVDDPAGGVQQKRVGIQLVRTDDKGRPGQIQHTTHPGCAPGLFGMVKVFRCRPHRLFCFFQFLGCPRHFIGSLLFCVCFLMDGLAIVGSCIVQHGICQDDGGVRGLVLVLFPSLAIEVQPPQGIAPAQHALIRRNQQGCITGIRKVGWFEFAQALSTGPFNCVRNRDDLRRPFTHTTNAPRPLVAIAG